MAIHRHHTRRQFTRLDREDALLSLGAILPRLVDAVKPNERLDKVTDVEAVPAAVDATVHAGSHQIAGVALAEGVVHSRIPKFVLAVQPMRSCQQVPVKTSYNMFQLAPWPRLSMHYIKRREPAWTSYDKSTSLILALGVMWMLPWYELYASVYSGREKGFLGSVTCGEQPQKRV